MREAGTVIVSLVSSSITSFRRITTWWNKKYIFFFQIKVFGHHCLLVVKLRLLSYRSPQLAKQSNQLSFESKINPKYISNGKWRVTLTS